MTLATYFSDQHDLRSLIFKEIGRARIEVNVAVAWFTDAQLFNALLAAAGRGVKVNLILTNSDINHNSRNDYGRLVTAGGYFATFGSDKQLMHMKFCVIDGKTVISGSANWTYSAFDKHREEITIVQDSPARARQFNEQFDNIRSLLSAAASQQAASAGQAFDPQQQGIMDREGIERIALTVSRGLLGLQVELATVEKNELERQFDLFNRRFILELHPLQLKILELKNKLYAKLKKQGYRNEAYEKFREEQEHRQRILDEEKEKDIPDLSEEDTRSIKKLYRQAVRLCHEDSPDCIYSDKQLAGEVFSELTEAYKSNNLDRVREILELLKSGQTPDLLKADNLEELRRIVAELEAKLTLLQLAIGELQSHEAYELVMAEHTWAHYFKAQKINLYNEYQSLLKQ
jgi:HKD family nuclease